MTDEKKTKPNLIAKTPNASTDVICSVSYENDVDDTTKAADIWVEFVMAVNKMREKYPTLKADINWFTGTSGKEKI